MRLSLCVFALGAFLFGLSATAFAQPEVQAIFARGNEHLQAKRWDAAIREYTEAIRLRPDVAGLYFNRGVAWFGKRVDEPKRTYQQEAAITADLKPDETPPKSQNSLNAIADFTKAISLGSTPPHPPYYGRARVYIQENDLEPAILDLRKFIELHPTFAQNPNYNDAGAKLTKISNDFAEKLVTRGLYEVVMASYLDHGEGSTPEQIKQHEKEMGEIKAIFRKATEYYRPNNSFTRAGRARAYLQLDNFSAAISDFEAAVKLTPNDANLVSELAGAYKRNKQFDKAIGVYNTVLAMPETHSSIKIQKNNALYRRAELYFDQNKLAEALADLNNLLIAVPTYQVAYFLRGRVYANQGERTLARADFVKASETSGLRKIAQIEIDKLDGKTPPKPETVKPAATTTNSTAASVPLPTPVWRKTSSTQIETVPRSALGLNSPQGLNLLCRASYQGSIVPGIVLGKKCTFGDGGAEASVHFFEIYLTSDNPKLELLAKEGEKYAIGKDSNGAPLYLCYLNYQNWWLPGKVVNGTCHFTWQGKELSSATFNYGYLAPAKPAKDAVKP